MRLLLQLVLRKLWSMLWLRRKLILLMTMRLLLLELVAVLLLRLSLHWLT